MGLMRLGILSTADINRKVIPGAHASEKVELVAVASREQAARGGVREDVGDRARVRLVRRAPRGSGCRRRLHLAAEHDAPRVVDQVARSGQARHLREAVQQARRRRRSGIRRRRASRPPPDGGLHVPAQPADAKLAELVREGAIGELRVVRSAFSYSLYDADNIRLRTDVEGGSLMDVGCYCVSGSRLLGGEPESVYGQAFVGPSGTDWVFTGAMRFPGDVHALFDCGTCLPERDELEAIGTEGSLFLDDPWHCNEPVIELRRDDGRRADRARPSRLLPARARESERRHPRRGAAPSRPRGCRRSGADDRGTSSLGRDPARSWLCADSRGRTQMSRR